MVVTALSIPRNGGSYDRPQPLFGARPRFAHSHLALAPGRSGDDAGRAGSHRCARAGVHRNTILRLFREIEATEALMNDLATSSEECDRLYDAITSMERKMERER